MRARRLCAAIGLAASLPLSTTAAPIHWPADGTGEAGVAFHCAAVMTAFGQAYEFATELTGSENAPRFQTPTRLVDLAGGPDRLGEIAEAASAWRDNWESLGRTSFYPRLTESGTPYLADDGLELQSAVSRCAAHFEL
ncbi:hypothetical protein GTA62_01080 [Roseobacter sp. HKCCD9010]|uniref:hypothetical protein n=1 Tax=Rhodobacterales TaxID=204455 RepID=UPI0014919DEB|nr:MULTISPECIES: hypothetical protein [Rhodobacterales]MBF9049543.1 hypothetical protein [Rhodobacterales bacterium HKCCD4356]NNV11543.1 hypothetical protein [Roseobacter sp. HKCCD7357]NNV15727.1 hypothetical protein [Roseobacter sp. HKCCD8768]NNV25187.1 hypothetical protein [Roseobacter sp. HKCCD8192]NNV29444.1 hypothetical protein [Roseobacter sp. HKCCD9061]